AGITAVGEFHYFHHGAAKHALDEAILGAARDAGIRIVLLMTYYKTGGINQPLSPAQQRFATPSLSDFFAQLDALAKKLDTRTQSLGVAAHSIRGVPLEELQPLYLEARRRGMPFHMHVEEQCRELEESIAAYGATPLQLINERFASCEGFTAVHATHSDPAQLARFIEKGGSVCITPLTEANLGDGIPDVTALLPHPDRLSLGTDSNARISMLEEKRGLEYAQRLRSETRGVYRDANGRNAARLLQFATTSGARALGIDASSDFIAVDLDAPAIAAAGDEHLLEAIVFGAGDDVIRSTIVNGR
ncbi:MAG TPA: amidohydrolase family protein, partial [Thermoanaerobaculia bacterium]